MASTAASSSSLSAPRVLYRSLLRELRANPTNPRKVTLTPAFESQPIVRHVRETFRQTAEDGKVQSTLREMRNLETYLRSNRLHKALLLRYNPFHDQTEQERVKATARRVGLDVPKEYVPGTAAAQAAKASGAASGEDVEELKKFLEGKRGPLPPPELESRFGGL